MTTGYLIVLNPNFFFFAKLKSFKLNYVIHMHDHTHDKTKILDIT